MRFNEKSVAVFTITPRDESGKVFVPTSARYRLDDLASQAPIIAWTDVSELSASMTVTIPSSSNAILNANLLDEEKVLTVSTDYGTSVEHNEQLVYKVRNLHFVS